VSSIFTKDGLLILAAVALVAGLVGFIAGRSGAPEPVSPAASQVSTAVHGPRKGSGVADAEEIVARARQPSASQDKKPPTMTLSDAFALADPKNREREMGNILAAASLPDVKKGLDWALALPEGFAKLDALQRIMDRWGQLDGPAAAAYGEQVLASTGRSDLLEEALRGWGQTDPTASLGYAQSMAVGNDVKRSVSRGIIRDWADRSPQAAASFAAENQVEVGRGGWPGLVADRWSKQDPSSAAAWAASLPEGDAQRRAYDEVVQNWCDLNIQSAAAFVASQPAGPNKEVMVSTLAREVAKLDPPSALQWASTLSDPVMQEDTAWSIMRRSVRNDPAAALELLQKSSLSAPVQQAISTRITARQNEGQNNGGP